MPAKQNARFGGGALHTTRPVVLRTFKHSDKSTVLKACTEVFGVRTYFVRTGTKGAAKGAALQPLERIELVVTEAAEREMHTVREVRVERPYMHVHTDPMRGLLALFTQEVLYKTLREEAGDAELFATVQRLLERMDMEADAALYPLELLIGLMDHLGIRPMPPEAEEDRFDMREGHFFHGRDRHEFCIGPAESALLAQWLRSDPDAASQPAGSAAERRSLLNHLLVYFRLHVDGFGELRSLPVLQAILA